MIVTEQIHIAAPAEEVWAWVAEPEYHAEWNEKVVRVERSNQGCVRPGERFQMAYRMSRQTKLHDVEVTDIEPPRRVTYLHRTPFKGFNQHAEEMYEIAPDGDGVIVSLRVDMSFEGVAWPWRALIWLIMRFGKPTGASPLEKLKSVVEQCRPPRRP